MLDEKRTALTCVQIKVRYSHKRRLKAVFSVIARFLCVVCMFSYPRGLTLSNRIFFGSYAPAYKRTEKIALKTGVN